MKEPTILDFVKALLTPWRGKPPAIPPLEESQSTRPSPLEVPITPEPEPESLVNLAQRHGLVIESLG